MKKIFLVIAVLLLSGFAGAENIVSRNDAFIENKGQFFDQNAKVNTDILYSLKTKGLKIFIKRNGFSYEIEKCLNPPISSSKNRLAINSNPADDKFYFESCRVDIEFESCNSSPLFLKEQQISENDRFYNTIDGLPIVANSFRKVICKNIYNGVDLHFLLDENGLFKYDIILQDGGDLNKIKLAYKGALGIERGVGNKILIKTTLGDIEESVPSSFVIDDKGESKKGDILYHLSENDIISFGSSLNLKGKKVIIDPVPALLWGTYFGGGNTDMPFNVTSVQGGIIVTGQTMSTNNIATVGSYMATYIGDFDVFVVKFNKFGVRQWATYYGGIGSDRGYAVCTDTTGNIYIGGSTYSSNNIVTSGAWQEFFEGPDDAFIVKFNSAGIRLWGTYYGGNLHDFIANMVVDNNGEIVLTGHSRSSYNIATAGTQQPNLQGTENAIISKFSSAGNLIWGSYLGAGSFDEGWGIDVDNLNNIYVGGQTSSTTDIATVGSFQPSYLGGKDGFITKFSPNGLQVWGTYFGGTSLDLIYTLALDANDNIFVAGNTESSNTNNVIATPGAFQINKGSFDEAFLQKFNNSGQRIWGTFIGGNSADYIYSVKCIKSSGDLVTAGYTESDDNISTIGCFQPLRAGVFDAMVMKFNNSGQRNWGTYYGGLNSEECKGLCLSENNNVVIVGHTFSTSGISTTNAHQVMYGGGLTDGFIAKICTPLIPLIIANDTLLCEGDTLVLSANNGFISYLWSNASSQPQTINFPASGTYSYWLTATDTNNCPGESPIINITVLPSLSVPVITLSGNTLTSSQSDVYQWYFNGNVIQGAAAQSYTATQDGNYKVVVSNSGCSAESEMVVVIITDLEKNMFSDNAHRVNISPNPANETIYISMPDEWVFKEIEILIYDISGRIIYRKKAEASKLKINTSALSRGMYIVSMNQQNKPTLLGRFIKQ